MIASRQFGLERLIRVGFEAGHAVFARFEARQQQRKFPIARRTAYQAHPRGAFEDLLAFLLRHAPEHADHFARLASKIISRVEFAEARKYFLRRFFPNTARVVKNEARLIRRTHLPVPSP